MGFGMATGQELQQPYLDFPSLDQVAFWICYYGQCHLHSDRRYCQYQILFKSYNGRNISGKSPFKTTSFVDGYINFAPLDWYGSWICCSSKCYINSEQLRLETNTPTRKVYILNSRYSIFRSVRYYSDIGRFNRRRYVNLGYVILMMMMYNVVIWIY